MNSDMILDTMRALALRWQDLAVEFERLADTIGQQIPPPLFVIGAAVPPAPPPTALLANLVGVANPPAPAPNTLRGRSLAEMTRVNPDVQNILQLPGRTTQLLLSNAPPGLPAPPAPNPNGAIETFAASQAALLVVETNAIPTPGFNTLFVNPANDTLRVSVCRDRIAQLRDFIVRSLRGFRELQDATGFTERFDVRGIRGSVDNLSAYPILTSDSGGTRAIAPNGGGGGGRDEGTISRSVTGVIREVLGRSPRGGDTRAIVSALNACFTVTEVDGRTETTWSPRSFVG